MVEWTLELIRNNAPLAYAVITVVCFAESFAFISLLVPGWAFMVAAGALVGSGALHPVPAILGAAVGAALGDAVSYWIGIHFKHLVPRMWPFTRHPDWLDRGHAFFNKWGGTSVFLGRFFGPIRAVIPLAAGMMEMPQRAFWIANIGSAVPWAFVVIGTGWGGGKLVRWFLDGERLNDPVVQAALALGVVAAAALYFVYRRWSASKTE
jgi:membrane protein DedA with SNARE-associated domain